MVVHVGCVDHLPLIEDKIKRGQWMHSRIDQVAKRCLGVDISVEGINYLKEHLSYKDVYCHDITSEPFEEIVNDKWDYLFLGEILEHVDNPVGFLSSIQELYRGPVKQIVISVPNAFRLDNFYAQRKRCELINSDHRYWFTPYTLAKVMTQAGIRVEEFHFVTLLPLKMTGIRTAIKKVLLRRYPAMRDTLVAVGELE